jgi:hypothetical protein
VIVPVCVLIDRIDDAPVRRRLGAWLARPSRAVSAAEPDEAAAVES